MNTRTLSRRMLLRGAGGVAMALPFLEAMRPRVAHAGPPPPRRLVLWYTANGTVPDAWLPGPNFAFNKILEPLNAYKQRLVVLSGLGMLSGGGDKKGHNRGTGTLWTGLEPNGGNDGDSGYGSGISVDQYIAQKIKSPTKFATVEVGVQVKATQPRGRMIYAGPAQPIPPEDSPTKLFNRLFGDFGAGQAELDKLRARRKTVIDAVKGDFDALNAKVGAADRQKLDAHLTAVRAIETRLDNLQETPAACVVPDEPGYIDYKKNENFPMLGQVQMDLLVMALACDLTRIASIMWSGALSPTVHTWLGHTVDHHTISHFGDPTSVQQLVDINAWYMTRLKEFMARLEAITEDPGTVLDRTIVCCGSDLGKGQPHYCTKIPFLVTDGGYFKGGRHVVQDGRSHNDLLLSLMHGMGVPESTFGDPAFCGGPIAELLG